jgi:hypothetical protein
VFVALLENDKIRVEAANAIRELRHICPRCFEPVILHRGTVKRPHFKHSRDAGCPYGQGETWQHENAKNAIMVGARVRGLEAEPELEVLSIDGDRRADVVVFAPSDGTAGRKLSKGRAFEVQYSAISFDHLIARTNAYMSAGVPVLWIAVIDDDRFKTIHRVEKTSLVCVSQFSVPSWVEHIALLHRRLWIYIPQADTFWRAWLLPSWCYRNPTEDYYDSNGEQHSGSGGYWYQAAKKRDLYLDGPFSFDTLKIATANHSDNVVIAPNGEKRWLVELHPHGIETVVSDPIEQRRTPHYHKGKDTGFYNFVEWVSVDGRDIQAKFIKLDQLPRTE